MVHSVQESVFQVWQSNKHPGPAEDPTDLPPLSSWTEELNIMQEEGKKKILLSVMLEECYDKSLATILTFKWHFCWP